MCWAGNPNQTSTTSSVFDPEVSSYDYIKARQAGMTPDDLTIMGVSTQGKHWGSVAPTSEQAMRTYGLPSDSYLMLKGRKHESWYKGVQGERERGYAVKKYGDRYYSIPTRNPYYKHTITDSYG